MSRNPAPKARLISSLAMLAVVAGGGWFYSVHKTGELLDIGVNAHVQCVVTAVSPATPHPSSEAERLGADLTGAGFQVGSTGKCAAVSRDFDLVVLEQSKTPVSIALTRRNPQDVFPRSFSGNLHEGDRQGYAVAAFESGGWLAYIVSALPDDQHHALALRLTPIISRHLPATAY
jgi:hypothetical protein